jgi:dTDP-4-dehydrorhamnose reductase
MKALNQERIQVVQDQVGSPTNSEDLARGIIAMLQEKPLAGIYHFSNIGKISWYEFAVRIYELAGADTQLVEPIGSTVYPSKVKRPANSVLSTEKWSKAEITKIVDWDESLVQIFPRILESVRKEAK